MTITDPLSQLTGPGRPFEIIVEDVLGVPHRERGEPLPRNPAGKVLQSVLRGDASACTPSAADDSAL